MSDFVCFVEMDASDWLQLQCVFCSESFHFEFLSCITNVFACVTWRTERRKREITITVTIDGSGVSTYSVLRAPGVMVVLHCYSYIDSRSKS